MNKLLNPIVLDHLYIGAEEPDFDALLPLTNLLSNTHHKKVQTDNDHWEGIYLRSNAGSYFEILRERRLNGVGLAFRPRDPFTKDSIQTLQNAHPNLLWKIGTRSNSHGKPWFDWISLGNYMDWRNTYFNAWLMQYFPASTQPTSPPLGCTVDRFTELNLTLGSDRLEDTLIFQLPDRDDRTITVRITLIPGSAKFQFSSFTMAITKGESVKSAEMGRFVLKQEGNVATLSATTTDVS